RRRRPGHPLHHTTPGRIRSSTAGSQQNSFLAPPSLPHLLLLSRRPPAANPSIPLPAATQRGSGSGSEGDRQGGGATQASNLPTPHRGGGYKWPPLPSRP
uniref:Uncharacterized protein n=1 Tax=Aegilops tauschii subsp. strangulata TaxID=200361 RepID=A0A453A8I6_AEGTS